MTDYATLQMQVANFSARNDLTAQIPTFILLAEEEIARDVRVLEQQVPTTLTIPDTGSLALPTRFLGFRHVALSVAQGLGNTAELNYMSPDQFHELRLNRSLFSGIIPDSYYTIEAGNILVQPAPGTGETFDLDVSYWQRFEPLSSTVTTNWLLTNHFGIYLYAVLAELWSYIMDTEQEGKTRALYQGKVNDLQRSERRKQRSGPHVRRPRFAP